MSNHARLATGLLGLMLLAACADPQPPVGRWQGVYEDSGLMVAARLEIDSAGAVRISAPNAMADFPTMSEGERANLRARLTDGLNRAWPAVAATSLEFDGHEFRKPGGVAPQLEWDAKGARMTLIFYSGNRRSVRLPLNAVEEFGAS